MKKILLTTILALAGLSLHAQGTVDFSNTSANRITTNTGGALIIGTHYMVGLYYVPPGEMNESAFVLLGATTSIAPLAGRYQGGVRTTPATTAAGSPANFQVRAFEAAFGTTFEQASGAPAQNRNGVIRQAFVGKTPVFNNPTGGGGNPAGPPANLVAPAFTVAIVPEPSAIALGILGLTGLFLLRRRK